MDEVAVIDTSAILLLTDAGLFSILPSLYSRVVAPGAVIAEVEAHGPDDPAVRAVHGATWLEIVEPAPPIDPPLVPALGIGETHLLAWAASHPGAIAVLDDKDASAPRRPTARGEDGLRDVLLLRGLWQDALDLAGE